MIVRQLDEKGAVVTETSGDPIEKIGPKLAHWASNQPVGWQLILERENGDPESPVATYDANDRPIEA
jgi:hypothetical protein